MTTQVRIKEGTYANKPVVNEVFRLVKEVSRGKNGYFVTVDGSELTGQPGRNIRVMIDNPEDVTVEETKPAETDEQAITRIRKRFSILDKMTDSVANGVVRGLIVSGPPGVGKSFGVETILDEYDAMAKLSSQPPRTEVVKGSMTPIGLYQTLFNNSAKGDILVFDDCDSILFDEVCLNMLKAVLDSGKKRTISWKSESAALRREGIPDRFDFAGGVIFITNIKFDNVKSKKLQDHLQALQSRCHYLDLTIDSMKDRMLRIKQICRAGMLEKYAMGAETEADLINFIFENKHKLREISLRMVLKIADLWKMAPDKYKMLAENTCMKAGS